MGDLNSQVTPLPIWGGVGGGDDTIWGVLQEKGNNWNQPPFDRLIYIEFKMYDKAKIYSRLRYVIFFELQSHTTLDTFVSES
jgi:hypothetical protein